MVSLPLIVRRIEDPSRACDAFWIDSNQGSAILHALGRFSLDDLERLHRLEEGVIYLFSRPVEQILPGVVRLRRVGERFFVPIDGELVPGLLADEIAGLTRDCGVVILPNSRAYSFDPMRPIALSELIEIPEVASDAWSPLPIHHKPADSLDSIEYNVEPSEHFLEDVSGIGDNSPGLDDSPLGAKIVGQARLAAARAMMGLGGLLGNKGMKKAGAEIAGKVFDQIPKLGESIFGAQKAAIMSLLAEFRKGNLDAALRKAPPLGGGEASRGAGWSSGTALHEQPFEYSLKGLLGDGSGAAGLWFGGGGDILARLADEYRKAALECLRQNDFRRASLIYAKLLSDYQSAANALMQGGFYRDAAVLLQTRLSDSLGAAHAYEAAGDFDKALKIYCQLQEHVRAGDLSKRMGDLTGAFDYYSKAARKLIDQDEPLQAGELILLKTGRDDMALSYWKCGWETYPNINALACASRMAVLYADKQSFTELLALVQAVLTHDDAIGKPENFNPFLKTLDQIMAKESVDTIREDIKDYLLIGSARSLNERAVSYKWYGNELIDHFRNPAVWGPSFLSDANFAVNHVRKTTRKAVDRKPTRKIRVTNSEITAVAYAKNTEELFLLAKDGKVYLVNLKLSAIKEIMKVSGRVDNISLDATGSHVVFRRIGFIKEERGFHYFGAVRAHVSGVVQQAFLESFRRVSLEDERFEKSGILHINLESKLSPCFAQFSHGSSIIAITENSSDKVRFFRTKNLVEWGDGFEYFPSFRVDFATPLDLYHFPRPQLGGAWLFGHECWELYNVAKETLKIGFHSPSESGVKSPNHTDLSFISSGNESLEMLTCSEDAPLLWWERARLNVDQDPKEIRPVSRVTVDSPNDRFQVGTLIRPGVAGVVTKRSIRWYRFSDTSYKIIGRLDHAIPDAIACFSFGDGDDLVIVRKSGVVEIAYLPK